MGLGTKFSIYLLASFGMVVLALYRILPVNYLGEIVIVLFISGLIFAWLNAWRQTEKLVTRTESSEKSEAIEKSEPTEESVSIEKEELIAA